MKKKLFYIATSISLISSFAVSSVASANIGSFSQTMATEKIDTSSNSHSNDDSSSTSDSSSTTETEHATESTTDDSTSRTTRIEKAKKELKETLSTEVKARIAARCGLAQDKVKDKNTNNSASTTARTNAYNSIVSKLQELVTAGQAKSLDVTQLQSEITVLQSKIASFKTANTTYRQALTDLSALDCKTDPVAFKAALETARKDQLAVLAAAKDIRNYLTTTVKVTLQTLKTQLNAAKQ